MFFFILGDYSLCLTPEEIRLIDSLLDCWSLTQRTSSDYNGDLSHRIFWLLIHTIVVMFLPVKTKIVILFVVDRNFVGVKMGKGRMGSIGKGVGKEKVHWKRSESL